MIFRIWVGFIAAYFLRGSMQIWISFYARHPGLPVAMERKVAPSAADKRGLVVKLRDLKLVEEFAGDDGRLRFATTEAFLQRFGLASLGELTAVSLSDSQSVIRPFI
jgi:hypothetical protein